MYLYGICNSISYFCRETCFSKIRSWFHKIYDNIPKFWYLEESTNTSQSSVPPHSVGLHHVFRVKLRLRWFRTRATLPHFVWLGLELPPCLPDPALLADVGSQAKGWDLLWLTMEGSQEHRAAHALYRGCLGLWGSKAEEVALPLMQPLQLRARCNWL